LLFISAHWMDNYSHVAIFFQLHGHIFFSHEISDLPEKELVGSESEVGEWRNLYYTLTGMCSTRLT